MATIGHEFNLKIYTRRWGHDENIKVKLTATGWHVHHMTIGGDCKPNGEPFLFKNLTHDSVNFPEGLRSAFEFLFHNHQSYTDADVQATFDQLGDWVSSTERNTPTGGALKGLW